MKDKSTINSVEKLKRRMDPLEGETVTLVLAEAHWESPCFATHSRRQAAAHKVRGFVQSLDISAHEGLAPIHLLKDFTDVS